MMAYPFQELFKRVLFKLDEIKDSYHYIIIDCPPSLGLATRIGLVASDEVIIPLECHEWAVKGTA